MNIDLHHIHAIIAEHGFIAFSNGTAVVRIIGEHIADDDDYHVYRVEPSAGCDYGLHQSFTSKGHLGRAIECAFRMLPAR